MMNADKEKNIGNRLIKMNKNMVEKFAAFAGLILLFVIFSIASPSFFSVDNIFTVVLQTSIIAYIGVGVTFPIITAGIDLSIGSVLALSGVTTGLMMKAGFSVWIAVLAGILVGIICGLINGFIIAKGKLPPFIATLGMMMVARGAALYITNAAPISDFPASFELIGGRIFEIIPVPVILMIVFALIFGFVLQKTKLGRYTYAIGSSEEAARLSGINIDKVIFSVYAISGGLAAVCGIVLASRLVTAQATAGQSYELDAIASAVIGGTSLMGGVGTITGTIIGSLIIGVLRNGLNMMGVSSFVQTMVIGLVIIGAVYIDRLRNKKG